MDRNTFIEAVTLFAGLLYDRAAAAPRREGDVVLGLPLYSLGRLSLRAVNALHRAGVDTIRDVLRLDRAKLLSLPHIGETLAVEIEEFIQYVEAKYLSETYKTGHEQE